MDEINPWLAALLALSQLAGIAGFVLGLCNYRHAKQLRRDAKEAPKRADQRRYREQLRSVVLKVQQDCESAHIALRAGTQLPDEIPESITTAEARLNEIRVVLTDPDSSTVQLLAVQAGLVHHDWRHLHRTQERVEFYDELAKISGKPPSPSQNEEIRMRHAADIGLKEAIHDFLRHANEVIDRTVELDDKE